MQNEKRKNITNTILIAIIAVLSTILVSSLTGILNFENDNTNQENNTVENNFQNTNNLLTELEALELGEELYEYANNVAWDKEFEYIHNQPDGSLILNYEEVISKFTQKYISSTGNIFGTIKKGDDGKYYDSSVRGFGVSCAKVSLTDLNVTNISNNYITFDAIATTTSTSKECGGLEVGTVVRTDKQTFGIKKENDIWKIDVYEFQYVTE